MGEGTGGRGSGTAGNALYIAEGRNPTSPGMQRMRNRITNWKSGTGRALHLWGAGAFLAVLAMGGAGCSSRITNLTPSALPREQSGLYHFETEWTSTQRTRNLAAETIKAFVVIDQKFHPMERVARMTNRWEAEIPIPASQNPVFYRFKWDYETAGFGKNVPNSLRSPEYRLEIVEPAGK